MFGSNKIEAVERILITAIFSSNEFHPKNIGNSKTPKIATADTNTERNKITFLHKISTFSEFLNRRGIR